MKDELDGRTARVSEDEDEERSEGEADQDQEMEEEERKEEYFFVVEQEKKTKRDTKQKNEGKRNAFASQRKTNFAAVLLSRHLEPQDLVCLLCGREGDDLFLCQACAGPQFTGSPHRYFVVLAGLVITNSAMSGTKLSHGGMGLGGTLTHLVQSFLPLLPLPHVTFFAPSQLTSLSTSKSQRTILCACLCA